MFTVNLLTLLLYAALVAAGWCLRHFAYPRLRRVLPTPTPPPASSAPAPVPAAVPVPTVIPVTQPSAQELLAQRVLALEQSKVNTVRRPAPRPRPKPVAR